MELYMVSAIYLLALAVTLWYALTLDLTADRLEHEYAIYEAMVNKEGWTKARANHELVASCFTAILLPYYIQRVTHLNSLVLFKVFPCFFYSAMPAFVYLIARQHLDIGYSLIASACILSNFFFLYYPNMGRVSIALGFLSGMFWALFSGHIAIASVFAVLMIISHYGTAYFTLCILLMTWVVLLVKAILGRTGYFDMDFISVTILLVVIAIIVYLWQGKLFQVSREKSAQVFLKRSFSLSSESLDRPIYPIKGGVMVPASSSHAVISTKAIDRLHNFLSLESRDPIIQVAFGKTLRYMNIPQRMEFALSWLMVLCLTVGVIFTTCRHLELYIIMCASMFLVIIATVILPHVSIFYGMGRVYLTALTVLAPCFAIGISMVAEAVGINGYVLGTVLVLLYALCVSGIMHSMFGITKRS